MFCGYEQSIGINKGKWEIMYHQFYADNVYKNISSSSSFFISNGIGPNKPTSTNRNACLCVCVCAVFAENSMFLRNADPIEAHSFAPILHSTLLL